MILENIIRTVANYYKVDYNQLLNITEQCRLKGIITRHELMQFDNSGIPFSKVLKGVLSIDSKDGLAFLIEDARIGYNDVVCVFGIIGQDAKVQTQTRNYR